MSVKSQPTPTGSTSPAAFRQGNSVELLFEPTGDLEKDYCAYCEIEDKNDRDDIIEGIIREELDPFTGLPFGASSGGGGVYAVASAYSSNTNAPAPTSGLAATLNMNNNSVVMSANEYDSPHSASQHHGALSGGPGSSASLTQQSGNCSPHSATNNSNNANTNANISANMAPIVRTTVNLRNLSYCLNKRDMQPLADAIPHCPSLTAVRMTGCGLTDHSYKQLVEAVYKSASIHTLAVDLNPDGLFKDPTVTRKGDRNDIFVYASEYRGAHLRSAEEREDGAGGIGGHTSGAAAGGAGVGGAGAAGAKRAPPKPSRPAATTKKNVDKLSAEAADRTPIPLPTGWHAALLTGIQVLSLRGNGITDAQLEPLCALLSTNTELMSLSLWGNRITSAGAAMLAKPLASNGKLVTLNLGHNLLDDEAVVALMGAFLTRDVSYEEMCRYRSGAHALLAASVEKSAAEGVAGTKPSGAASGAQSSGAAAGGGAVGGVQLPPSEPPLFPTYGDIAAAAIAKQIEEGTIATIKALGVPISATTGQAPTTKKKEVPAIGGGKRKGAGEGPVERPTDPYDDNVVRLLEDPIASPATTSLIAQQLYTAVTSSSAAAAQAAVVQLQQLSQFRVPGNTALAALNLSFNPNITADGIAFAVSVLRSRPPTAEALYQQMTQGAVGIEFSPIGSATSPSNINAKGAPPTPSATIFGAPITAAIPTLAGHQGLNAPAANASVVAAQMQTAIMSAPHLHTLSKTCHHHMVDCCSLRQLDIESSKINPVVLSQLQQAVQERRTFAAEKRLAAERGGAGTPGQGLE